MTENRWITVNVSLGDSVEDVALKQWLREAAAARGMSMSRFVKHLILIAANRDRQRRPAAAQ